MIRPARKTDAKQAIPIIMQILHDMEIPAIQAAGEQVTQELLIAAFDEPNYRYGYPQMLVYEDDQTHEVLGVCVGYPAAKEAGIDQPLVAHLAEFGFDPKSSFFGDVESRSGEWYLDSLAVSPKAQGKGIGGKLLDYLPDYLRAKGEQRISLNVDLGNPAAKRLYSHHGFKKIGEQMIGAHKYEHLVRELD